MGSSNFMMHPQMAPGMFPQMAPGMFHPEMMGITPQQQRRVQLQLQRLLLLLKLYQQRLSRSKCFLGVSSILTTPSVIIGGMSSAWILACSIGLARSASNCHLWPYWLVTCARLSHTKTSRDIGTELKHLDQWYYWYILVLCGSFNLGYRCDLESSHFGSGVASLWPW